MNDFDKELTRILRDYWQADTEKIAELVKQAVDKYVIAKNETVQYVDDEPATELDDYAETRNDLRDKQRQSLWNKGDDK